MRQPLKVSENGAENINIVLFRILGSIVIGY